MQTSASFDFAAVRKCSNIVDLETRCRMSIYMYFLLRGSTRYVVYTHVLQKSVSIHASPKMINGQVGKWMKHNQIAISKFESSEGKSEISHGSTNHTPFMFFTDDCTAQAQFCFTNTEYVFPCCRAFRVPGSSSSVESFPRKPRRPPAPQPSLF